MSTSSLTPLLNRPASNPRERDVKLRPNVLITTFVACLGTLSFGFVVGYPSPVARQLQTELSLSIEEISWFNSVYALASIMGSILGIYAVDRFGRKATIMLSSVPFVSGWVLIAAARSESLLLLGRILTGLGVGAVSLTVPVYIAEISPAKYRGALVSISQVGLSLGILIAFCLGPLFDNWRWLAIAGAVPPTLMVMLMTTMPETPYWFIKKERMLEAIRVLKLLRLKSEEEIKEECSDIASTMAATSEKISPRLFLKPSVYRPLILSISLMILQQFGGLNNISNYATTILAESGFKNVAVVSIVFGAVNVVFTVISCIIVDKLGRRKLLIYSGILIGVSMAMVGVFWCVPGFPKTLNLLFFTLYVIGYSIGWIPVPWLIMSEIFPTRVRGVACGINAQVNRFSVFLVVKTFPQLKSDFHIYGAYFFYGGICLLAAVVVFFFLPETKGRTLEEIEELFSGHAGSKLPYWKSNNYGAAELLESNN